MTLSAVLGMYLSWIVILDECGALLLGEGHGWQRRSRDEQPGCPAPVEAAAAATGMLHLR